MFIVEHSLTEESWREFYHRGVDQRYSFSDVGAS